MNTRISLSLLFLSFSMSALLAQTPFSSIKGIVLDRASEAPVLYATITILDSDPLIGTTSDAEGRFRLDNLPVGRYHLNISFLGFEPAIFKDVLVSAGKVQSINVYLKEAPFNLGEVVVRPKKNKEQPLNKMATVSSRQMNMDEAGRYAGGFDDPARLAASFAGVASNLTTNGIVVRGNAPKGLLWRIEGVDVPNPNHFAEISGFGAGGITALSSQMLAGSDFFTGAFPAEYGNALSGVFDLSIRNGNNEAYEHAFQASFLGLDASSEGPLKKGKQASYLFNYRYSTFGLIDAFLPEEDGLGIAYQDLSFKLNFPTKNAGTFSLWGLGLTDRASSEPNRDSSSTWRYYEDLESDDSKIGMGVLGLSHKQFLSPKTYLKTNLSISGNELSSKTGVLDDNFDLELAKSDINFRTLDFKLSSLINHKFSARHTNRSGINLSYLTYDLLLKEAPTKGETLATFTDDQGSSFLFQAYSQSSLRLGDKWTINPGLHFQYFLLNKQYSIEPRLGAVWQIDERQSLSFGYGLHSQLEKLSFYLSEIESPNGIEQANKDLDFAKAHHIALAYDRMLGAHTRLKIEPYVQFLFNVPVIDNNYFSFINLEDDFFINDPLINTGKGRNIGVDITLERFLNRGWYYLATATIFDSRYRGGDGVWRNSRFNKGFVANFLIGKEWTIKQKNMLSASLRFTSFGGDRIHPVDVAASLSRQDIVEDYSRAFEDQKPDSHLLHLTLSYRINKKKHSSLWSLQLLNALGAQDFYGYRYNFKEHTIDPDEETVVIPNLSYKIMF